MEPAPAGHRGQCACGAVSYRVEGALRPVTNCHCERCRRITGHFMAATAAALEDLTLTDRAARLTWYEPAPGVFYGFCSGCGSTLFWRTAARPQVWSIAAGTLDPPTGLTTVDAWFVAAASDYHRLDHDLRELPGDGAGGEEGEDGEDGSGQGTARGLVVPDGSGDGPAALDEARHTHGLR